MHCSGGPIRPNSGGKISTASLPGFCRVLLFLSSLSQLRIASKGRRGLPRQIRRLRAGVADFRAVCSGNRVVGGGYRLARPPTGMRMRGGGYREICPVTVRFGRETVACYLRSLLLLSTVIVV